MFRLSSTIGAIHFACQSNPSPISKNTLVNIGYVATESAIGHQKPRQLCTRSFSHHSPSTNSPSSDNVKIYSGNLSGKFWRVKLFSLSTSVLGISAQPFLIEHGSKIVGPAGVVAMCTMAGFFAFITPVLLHLVVKKYVIEMEHNPVTDEYTATTISLLMRKNKTTFKITDITIPEVPGMFTSFKVGKGQIPLFVDAPDFVDVHHYARFMGYDKPIDFKLSSSGDSNEITAEARPKEKTS